MQTKEYTQNLLHQMLGKESTFRQGQWEAIKTVAIDKKRVLVVQRTGWGKSLVYFLATKLLREQSAGPTLLISPLLSLMRNQIEMANRIGINALTINSTNKESWELIEKALAENACDILLISPERLNNRYFIKEVLPSMYNHIGMFVVDEAHCISDWGHDFRPDYRRIVRVLQMFPKGIPILGTTATANNRVIADIKTQLGEDIMLLRGSLERPSLRLQNIKIDSQIDRYTWLVENIPKFKGSGIIYCLTVNDTIQLANWLKENGFNAEAYHAGSDSEIARDQLENDFINNKIEILVATVALGMGFDKPDIKFIIHYQRPGSVIAYYQQVGRAGRSLDRAYGILLNGIEDDEIQEYFINSAFPSFKLMQDILDTLEHHEELSPQEILTYINVSWSNLEKALKILEIDGAIGLSDKRKYFRTPNVWSPDKERIEQITALRKKELQQMQDYISYQGCLMEFLQKALDDPSARPCGRCSNCRGKGLSSQVSNSVASKAEKYLRHTIIEITPRKYWPINLFAESKRSIPDELAVEVGRTLCYYGRPGWGKLVQNGKYKHNYFCDELVKASADLIINSWNPGPFPEWITAIPSLKRPDLVPDFALRLANYLNIPFEMVLERTTDVPEQKTMQNSSMQAGNVLKSLTINKKVCNKPVLLVDDIMDSRWTLTLAGRLLKQSGSGDVFPFTLAKATSR